MRYNYETLRIRSALQLFLNFDSHFLDPLYKISINLHKIKITFLSQLICVILEQIQLSQSYSYQKHRVQTTDTVHYGDL